MRLQHMEVCLIMVGVEQCLDHVITVNFGYFFFRGVHVVAFLCVSSVVDTERSSVSCSTH